MAGMQKKSWLWQTGEWLAVPEHVPQDMLDACERIAEAERRLAAMPAARLAFLEAESLACGLQESWDIEGIELAPAPLRTAIRERFRLDVPEWRLYARERGGAEDGAAHAAAVLLGCGAELSPALLCRAHAAMRPKRGDGLCGAFRTREEYVVHLTDESAETIYEAPPPEAVPALMAQFMDVWHGLGRLPASLASALAHLFFVVVHPFEDGNGRTARLLVARMLLQSRSGRFLPYAVSSVFSMRRDAYMQALDAVHAEGSPASFLRLALAFQEEAVLEAESRAASLAMLDDLFRREPSLTDEQKHVLRAMAMAPRRRWRCDEMVFAMADVDAACAAWDGLAAHGRIVLGRLCLEGAGDADEEAQELFHA